MIKEYKKIFLILLVSFGFWFVFYKHSGLKNTVHFIKNHAASDNRYHVLNIVESDTLTFNTKQDVNYNDKNFFGNLTYHTKTSMAWNEFKAVHSAILDQKRPLRISINFRPAAGYANLLYSMINALSIALITDSAFLVCWPEIIPFIQEPFDGTFLEKSFKRESNDFNVDFREGKNNKTIFFSCQNCWYTRDAKQLIKTGANLFKSKHANETRYFVSDKIEPFFFNLCTNPNYYNKFYSLGLVSKKTIREAKAVIEDKNSDNDYMLNHILRVPFEIGGRFLNKFWKPNRKIQKLIEQTYLKSKFRGSYLIGLQFRIQYLKDVHLNVQKFINCAEQIERTAKAKDSNFGIKYPKGVKWFATSDQEAVLNRLAKSYPERMVTGIGPIGHVGFGDQYYERTILDVELLGFCDELIITGGSTYGYVGSMKANRLPFFVKNGMQECKLSTFASPPTRPEGFLTF